MCAFYYLILYKLMFKIIVGVPNFTLLLNVFLVEKIVAIAFSQIYRQVV